MSKAYNRVNWNFLKAVLLFMNFGTTWVNWIMECISTVQYSLLVNGSPFKPFHPSRGLRQGDPISHYLFLFCANILSLALTREENQKNLKGVKIGRNGLSFTHILFADDSFIFFQNDNRSFIALKKKQSCGTVPYLDNPQTLISLSCFALPILIRVYKIPLPHLFRLSLSKILAST